MNIEERIFLENELSYDQIIQMKEHAKQYDYVVDKKDFLRSITPYEQKLVLLETRNPYEVLTYLDELDFENSRIILNKLTSTEIKKIIDEFTSEEKKKFYSNFSDLSLVNQFIMYDKNSKEHITNLETERKVEIIKSTKEETKEVAAKVYETVSEGEKTEVIDSIIDSGTTTVLNDVVSAESVENTEIVELEDTIQEEQAEEIQEEQAEEIQEEQVEEIQEEQAEEHMTELDDFIRTKKNFYIKNISHFSNFDFDGDNLYSKLSPELKTIIYNDFKLNNEERKKEILNSFQTIQTECEQELIDSVLHNIKEEPEEIQEGFEKTL